MEDNYQNSYDQQSSYDRGVSYAGTTVAAATSTMLRNVYLWMCGALVVTGLMAYYVSQNYAILNWLYGTKGAFLILCIAEIALVVVITAAINRLSALGATLLFLLYSVVNGVTLSSIFAAFDINTIGTTFFVTAGTFGAMAIVGSVTKRDLTKVGNILLMALIGLIIATLVNLFLKNSVVDLIISAVGVLIFVGLTAYDAQKIKAMLYGAGEGEMAAKIAVLGALTLYLDFINLFLYLLRFFGRRN